MIHQGHIKRRIGTSALISSRLRGTDCIAENCDLPVNTNVYYTRENRNNRMYATRVETAPFDLDERSF